MRAKMSLTTAPSTGPLQTNNIDPEGDIVFVVGDPKYEPEDLLHLRVSSKILRLASSTFAAMFSPKWNAGGVKDRSVIGRPREISLPDDDVEGITLICQALHFKKEANVKVDLPFLEMIATLVDKYDLSVALSSWIELRLYTVDYNIMNEKHLATMMSIASVINHHDMFWRFSLLILYGCPSKIRIRKGTMDPINTMFCDDTVGMFS